MQVKRPEPGWSTAWGEGVGRGLGWDVWGGPSQGRGTPGERQRVPQAEPKHFSLSKSSLSPHLRPWIQGGGGCGRGEPCAGRKSGRTLPETTKPPKGRKHGGRRGPQAGKQALPHQLRPAPHEASPGSPGRAAAPPRTPARPGRGYRVPSLRPRPTSAASGEPPTPLRPRGVAASPLSHSSGLGQSQTPGEGPAGWTLSESGAHV